MKKYISGLIALALAATLVCGCVCVVSATTKPTKMTITATAKTIGINEKSTIKVKTVTPADASKAVTYKSSDKKIATVSSNGVVTGKKKGTVKITVTSKANKKLKKTISIKVVANTITLKSTDYDKYIRGKTYKSDLKVKGKGIVTFTNCTFKKNIIVSGRYVGIYFDIKNKIASSSKLIFSNTLKLEPEEDTLPMAYIWYCPIEVECTDGSCAVVTNAKDTITFNGKKYTAKDVNCPEYDEPEARDLYLVHYGATNENYIYRS